MAPENIIKKGTLLDDEQARRIELGFADKKVEVLEVKVVNQVVLVAHYKYLL